MKKLNNKGFSLAELLAVMAILIILLGIAIASYTRVILDASKDAFIAEANTHAKGIKQFIESEDTHASRYTIGLQVFIHASVRFSSGLTICVRVNCSKNELVSLLDKAENRMSTTFSCDRREDIAPLRKRDSFADVYST